MINIAMGHVPSQTRQKGNSLIAFPSSYTIIDIETTGLSPEWDSIIEVAAVKVKDNQIIDSFSSIVNTAAGIIVDEYITNLTGITQTMIDEAPLITDILPKYLNFIGDDYIVGHNVNFDINFIYDKAQEYLNATVSNDFIDTLRLFRRLSPDKPHHRLSDLAEEYHLDYTDAHRALRDCMITQSGFQALKDTALSLHGTIDNFISTCKKKSYSHSGVKASDIHTNKTDFDVTNPFYGKTCVFTGALDKMLRKDAMQIVADLGGINGDSVTKKTNYLILGNNAYCKTIKDGKSSKQKKAEKLKLSGQDIEIIPENVFYDMLNE